MNPKTSTSRRIWLPVLLGAFVVSLASFDFQQTGGIKYQHDDQPTDTTPKKKKNNTEKKVRDLDDVLAELDNVDIDAEMQHAHLDILKALKEIDTDKIKIEIDKAMKQVDMQNIKLEIDKAMKEVDFAKIQKDVQESIAKIDFEKIQQQVKESIASIDFDKIQDQIKVSMEQVKKIDFDQMKLDMKEAEKELNEIKPKLEKEMADLKINLDGAKEGIEKAKTQIREYKTFVDDLDKDGLISKKGNYSIVHKNGELTIDGKKVSEAVYSKYKTFLDNHKKFNIEKSADDFDIDMD